MGKYLLYILFGAVNLAFSFTVNAQEPASKRISKIAAENPRVYIDSAKSTIKYNPVKAFDYVEKALQISIRNGDKSSEAQSYIILGDINRNLAQFDLALNYYHKAENVYKSLNDIYDINNTYLLLGDIYNLESNYSKSIEYYQLYKKYVDKNGTLAQQADVKTRLANVYSKSGLSDKAIYEYEGVIALEDKQNNARGVAVAQNKLGVSYKKVNQKSKALSSFKKAEEVAKESGDKEMVVQSLKNQGEVYRSTQEYDQELKVRSEILKISEQEKDKQTQAEANLDIATLYSSNKQADKAMPYIQKSIQLANETGNLEQKGKALQTLSMAYSSNAEYNKALDIYKQYVEIQDELYKQRATEIKKSYELLASLAGQVQRLNLIEKELKLSEQTVELLQQEKLVNDKTYRAQKVLTFSMVIALVVFIMASVLIYRSNLQKRKANQLLALKSLRSQMNPHFIYNSLNSVNNYISKSDEKSANKFLSDFSRLMRSVMDNSKHDFVPIASEIQIIEVYLKLEHSRFNDKFDYEFKVNPGTETDQGLIPPMLIQPFIENAIWHGLRYRPSKGLLKVEIKLVNESVMVMIEDNGIGRKKSESLKTKNQKEHNSTGLKNIENRIDIINQLYKTKIGLSITDIEEGDNTGTVVELIIPINK